MPPRKKSLSTKIADALTPQVKDENSSAARNDRFMASVQDFANSRSDVIAKKNLEDAETHSYDFRRQRGRRAPVMMKKGK